MSFAIRLWDSLRDRHSRIGFEFASGESLGTVLSRHLLAVESSAETQLLTSILLLDQDGKHLWHGAAPSLPKSYCAAIDGLEIGPTAGSCGTAAYLERAIYVTDVSTDPLWKDYRELALQHGLRACWSTPIRNGEGLMLGTFAVYHLTPRGPTPDEIDAISMITGHVARAIEFAHSRQDNRPAEGGSPAQQMPIPYLELVSDDESGSSLFEAGPSHDEAFAARLQAYANEVDRYAALAGSRELSESLAAVARDCRNLSKLLRDAMNSRGD